MLRRKDTLARNDGGQDLGEYGIALAVVGMVAVATALAIGQQVSLLWDPGTSVVDNVAHGNHGHHRGGGNSGNGGGNAP